MNKIEKSLVDRLVKLVNGGNDDITFEDNEQNKKFEIQCGPKCRLLSHLFHKAGLDMVHCNRDGFFEISYWDLPNHRDSLYEAIYDILENPQWIVEFIEKYHDNEFMIQTTFGPAEVGV